MLCFKITTYVLCECFILNDCHFLFKMAEDAVTKSQQQIKSEQRMNDNYLKITQYYYLGFKIYPLEFTYKRNF